MKKDVWVVLIFSLLFVVSSIASYMFYTSNEENMQKLRQAETAKAAESTRVVELLQENQDLSRRVGWTPPTGVTKTNIQEMENSINEYVKDFPQEWQQWITENLQYKGEITRLDALLAFYSYITKQKGSTILDLRRARDDMKVQLEAKTAELSSAQQQYATDIEQVRTSMQTQIDQLRTERDNFSSDLEKERGERLSLETSSKELLTTANNEIQDRDITIAKLSGELESIKSAVSPKLKPVSVEADGRVVFVAEDFSTVYIDLSGRHRIRPGLEFQVFRERKDGTWVMKGTVMVRKVMDGMSECSIIDIRNTANPILADDLIVNVVFDPEKTYHIGIIGSASGSAKYSREALQQMITDSGGVYDDSVTSDTDYVVLLSQPNIEDKNWMAVKDLNKEVMTVDQFLDMFGRHR